MIFFSPFSKSVVLFLFVAWSVHVDRETAQADGGLLGRDRQMGRSLHLTNSPGAKPLLGYSLNMLCKNWTISVCDEYNYFCLSRFIVGISDKLICFYGSLKISLFLNLE